MINDEVEGTGLAKIQKDSNTSSPGFRVGIILNKYFFNFLALKHILSILSTIIMFFQPHNLGGRLKHENK